MEQQGREHCVWSQCKSADQNKLPLGKEAALVPPLPLLAKVRMCLSHYVQGKGTGMQEMTGRWVVRDCSHELLKWKVFVWDTFILWK